MSKRHSNRPATLTAALMLVLLCHGASADVDAGIAAYKRRDFATAFAEFSATAKRDDPLSQNLLGIMYAEGLGVPRNDKLAVDWFFKAQTLGSFEATANLGRMYASGRGVPQSNSEALKHYREAALGGYPPAMKLLADIYEKGELGVTPDPAQAIEWRARLRGIPTGLMSSSQPPAKPAIPAEKPRQGKALPASVAPVADKPTRRDAPAGTQDDKNEKFERQVWEQLEKYRQRERKLQVASTDSTPALAPYLKDLRAKVKIQLASAMPAAKPFTGMAVSLSILRDGTLKEVGLDHGSSNANLDRKVLSSLKQLGPLPPLPSATKEMADVLVVTVKLPIE